MKIFTLNNALIAAIVLALACIIFCPNARASLPEHTAALISEDSYMLMEPSDGATTGDLIFVGAPSIAIDTVCRSAAANGYTLRSVRTPAADGNWNFTECK